jgi:hypothetical protein
MKINMANWDRIAHLVVGALLVAWAVAGGPWWAYFGLGLVAVAAFRFSPIYALLRMGTFRAD